ncbi:hypothetical protein Gpo141_00012106 [Globisporangium polare]
MDSLFKRWTLARKQAAQDKHGDNGATDNQQEQDDEQQQQQEQQEQETTTTGVEWICIEEPVGFFFPEMKKQRQLLELDQVRHVIHYANYKRVMRIHDISLVTSVEEVGADGGHQWWMSVQDPRMLQVWIVHFPSLLKLRLWVDLLRSVVRATGSRALVGDVVLASELDRCRSSVESVATCKKLETRDAEPEETQDAAAHCEIAIFVP